MSTEELVTMIEELNQCLPKELAEDRADAQFCIHSNGFQTVVLFGETYLWDTDNDERPWNEERDDYAISVKCYVVQEYNKLVELMNKANFTGENK